MDLSWPDHQRSRLIWECRAIYTDPDRESVPYCTGGLRVAPPGRRWQEPPWEEVAPGIFCKLMATDTERHRVACSCDSRPGSTTLRTHMLGSRNCFCSMASCVRSGTARPQSHPVSSRLVES